VKRFATSKTVPFVPPTNGTVIRDWFGIGAQGVYLQVGNFA